MFSFYKILYEIFYNKLSRFSISYIIKCIFFYKYIFLISYPNLIPRCETELIINIFIKIFSKNLVKYFFEGGFGSGILTISIVNIFSLNSISVDKNLLCFFLAKENSSFFFKKKKYFNCDWFNIFFGFKFFNIMIFNPPYLSINDFYFFKYLFESRLSLLSRNLGFYDLRNVISLSYDILCINGFLILEHGYSQSKIVRFIMLSIGFINVCTFCDDNGLSRFSCGEK